MKLTKKQKDEIDFYITTYDINPTDEEIYEYIEWTVRGKKPSDENRRHKNSLFMSKRKMDINIKMWTEDLNSGLLSFYELEAYYDNEYFQRLIKTIRKSLIYVFKNDEPLEFNVLRFFNVNGDKIKM